MPSANRRRAVVIAVAMGATFLALAMQLPGMLTETRAAAEATSLWSRPDEFYRRLPEGVPFDLLSTADALLPSGATVLLVTNGADVRIRDYTTFHRALYFLAPRPVHWMTPAPSDGTWESRSWTTRDLSRDSICGYADEVGAGNLLLVDVAAPEPPCPAIGGETRSIARSVIVGPVSVTQSDMAVGPMRVVLGALAALAIPLLIGASLLVFATRRSTLHPGLGLGAAWAIGAGIVSLVEVGLGALGLPIAVRLALPSCVAVVAFGVLLRIGRPLRLPGSASWPGVAAIGGLGAFVALAAVSRPLTVWDSWAIWGIKARTMFIEGGFTGSHMTDPTLASTHPGYPLNLPALETWLFNWIGSADDRLVGLISAATSIALLATIYGALRHWGASRPFAAVGVLVLGSMYYLRLTAVAGMADVPFALLATVAAVFLVEWLDNGRRDVLLVAALAAGLLPWTKMEGWVVVLILAVLAVVPGWTKRPAISVRRGLTAAGALIGSAALIAGPWFVYVAANHVPSADYQLSIGAALANLDRVPTILGLEARFLVGYQSSLFWPAAVVVGAALLLVTRRLTRGATWVLPAAAVAYIVLMSAAYLVTTFEPYTEQIKSSAFRLSLHVLPIAFIWTGLALRELITGGAAPPDLPESGRSSASAPLPAE
ncbi:MAG: hypothetical protein ABIP53_01755 [Candidatus Limnocylindrales bacterium]